MTTKSGTVFKTLAAAKDHFAQIRKDLPVGEMLPEPHRSDVIDIYLRYCHATNWSADDAVDVTTAWNNDKRPGDRYAQSKAFAIVTSSGDRRDSSIDRALQAIAK
ncbi:hypothetical protein [Tabrizicola sp. M-4]|uniref:hypothetical protein n=1 Tax=Tabrizicola sp. M-4 TaxID=3055847 RepID=UPI003DA99E99